MIIALLCFTMNPSCCFFQTLVGLLCYAYGLRDKGFEMLNALGCSSSIDHIRAHRSFWAIQRVGRKQILADLHRKFIKFAKNLPEGSTGAKKMLNLITRQSSTNSTSNNKPSQKKGVPTLTELIHRHIAEVTHCKIQ